MGVGEVSHVRRENNEHTLLRVQRLLIVPKGKPVTIDHIVRRCGRISEHNLASALACRAIENTCQVSEAVYVFGRKMPLAINRYPRVCQVKSRVCI